MPLAALTGLSYEKMHAGLQKDVADFTHKLRKIVGLVRCMRVSLDDVTNRFAL